MTEIQMKKIQEILMQLGEKLFISRCKKETFLPNLDETKIFDIIKIIPSAEKIEVRNIFYVLSGQSNNSFFPIAPLLLNKVWNENESMDIKKEFEDQIKSLPDGKGKFDSFCYLMDKYGSRINVGDPNISVAHYWKVLAAILHCWNPDELNIKPIMLFSGDVSGLVEFMRTKTFNMAAKNARARSFFIQLLSDAILRAILRHFGLPRCNLLFYGASRFMLLLPGDEVAEKKLDDIEKTISVRLLQLYRGLLAPQFAREKLYANELFDEGKFPTHLTNLWKNSSLSAYRLFQNIPDNFIKAFDPIGIGTLQTCNWCGAEIESDQSRYFFKDDNEWLCSECKNFGWTKGEKFGLAQIIAHAYHEGHVLLIRDLTNGESLESMNWKKLINRLDKEFKDHLSLWSPDNKDSMDRPTWREALSYFGYEYDFKSIQNIPHDFNGEIIQLNPGLKNSAQKLKLSFKNATYGWRWAGFATPMIEKEDEPNKFEVRDTEQFANDVPLFSEPQGYGVKRYGTLYLDGDGMGSLFRNCKSIFHYLSLSDNVALFFEGWVNQLCHEVAKTTLPALEKEEEKTAYLLYAGGDDLFIAGPWIILPELAFQIQRHYAFFVTQGKIPEDNDIRISSQPAVTLSATMSIAGAKFPLYHLLLENLERIKSTKDFWNNFKDISTKTKYGDCVDFLGQIMPWQDFETVMNIVRKFSRYLLPENEDQKANLPRNFLQRLYSIAENYKIEKKQYEERNKKINIKENSKSQQNEFFFGRWIWICIYSLTRAAQQLKPEAKEVIIELQQALVTNRQKRHKFNNGYLNLIQKLETITRWLELRTRKENIKNE